MGIGILVLLERVFLRTYQGDELFNFRIYPVCLAEYLPDRSSDRSYLFN